MENKTIEEIYKAHVQPKSKIPEGMDNALFQLEQAKRKPSKMKNKYVIIDGIKFQSTGEGNYYVELKHRLRAGDIKAFKRQVKFEFFVNGVRVGSYDADFVTVGFDGTYTVIDHKGRHTQQLPLYQIKRQLMKALYYVDIKEVGL